jgi:hypothetical protein
LIRPALLRAYRNTIYRVGQAEIRIGRRSPEMDRLLLAHKVRTASLLSAENPYSIRKPPGWNRRMHHRLKETIRYRMVLSATGQWQNWTERHFLLFGDPRPVIKLAYHFRQNAIVIVRLRQPAHLLITS